MNTLSAGIVSPRLLWEGSRLISHLFIYARINNTFITFGGFDSFFQHQAQSCLFTIQNIIKCHSNFIKLTSVIIKSSSFPGIETSQRAKDALLSFPPQAMLDSSQFLGSWPNENESCWELKHSQALYNSQILSCILGHSRRLSCAPIEFKPA